MKNCNLAHLMFGRKTFLIFLQFLCLTVSATTYYIDPSGNDATGNGSVAAPWKTLRKACSVVTTPGDVIHVNAGTYNEVNQSLLVPGVSIEGTGNTSVITSTFLTAENTPIISAQSDPVTNGNQEIRNLKFDGSNLAAAQAFWIIGRHNVKIHHCTFTNFHYMAIQWSGIGGTEETPPTSWVTGCEFYNNTVTNCAGYAGGWYRGALFIGGMDGILIHDNTMIETGRPTGSQGWPIKNWANGGWIKGSKIYNNHLEKTDCSVWDFCIESLWEAGLEIYNNTIIGAIDLNEQAKGTYSYSVYIHNNTLGPPAHGTYGCAGIIFEYQNDGIIIRNNYIKNCSPPVKFTPRNQNTQNFDFSYNVIENCANIGGYYGGIRFIGSGGITISHFYVQNNVIHGSSSASNPFYGIIIDSEGGIYSGNDFRIINNIFVNFNANYLDLTRAGYIDYLNIENNIIYNCGNLKLTGTPTHYTNLNNQFGVNPVFLSATDFHLQTGSPAINTGKDIGMTLDFDGNSVPNSTLPDIGAYEFGSSPPPTSIPIYLNSEVKNTAPDILEMSYDLSMANIVPSTSAFTVTVNSVSRPVSTVAVTGTKVLLTLSSPIVYGNIVTVAYTKPGTNPLQTVSGGEAATMSAQSVTNSVASIILPVYQSSLIANAAPSILEMTYDLSLANVVPATSAFTVNVNSIIRDVQSVSIGGTKVFLTLSAPIVYGDIVTVSYLKPATNPLQSVAGSQAITLSVQPVANLVNPTYEAKGIEVNIFPNPTDGEFNILISEPASESLIIKIFDLTGAMVDEYTIDLGQSLKHVPVALNPGLYIVQCISGKFILFAQKLIVCK